MQLYYLLLHLHAANSFNLIEKQLGIRATLPWGVSSDGTVLMIPPPEKLDPQSTESLCTLISQWLYTIVIFIVDSDHLFCEVPSQLEMYSACDAGNSVSVSISQMNSFVFQTVVVQEFRLFLVGVWQHTMYFFCSEASASYSPKLWHDERTQRAKQLPAHPAAVLNVLQYAGLYCTAVECRLWLRVAVCTPPHTHLSHCRSVCLCWRGSVRFRCISKYTALFFHFSQRGLSVLCAWIRRIVLPLGTDTGGTSSSHESVCP